MTVDPTTIQAIKTRKGDRSLRKLAREIEEPVGTLSDIYAGRDAHVSLRTENRVRVKLGLEPRVVSPYVSIGGLAVDVRDAHDKERRARRLTWNAYLRRLIPAGEALPQ